MNGYKHWLWIPGLLALMCSGQALAATHQTCAKPLQTDGQTVSVCLYAPGIVHVSVRPDGVHGSYHTLVMDPDAKPIATPHASVRESGDVQTLATRRMSVSWQRKNGELDIYGNQHHRLLHLDLGTPSTHQLVLEHDRADVLYGIGSYSVHKPVTAGIVRTGQQVAKSGKQGHAGGPFVWSTAGYGVLVDSDGATFDLASGRIEVTHLTQPVLNLYVMVGKPPQLFADLADLSGHAPMFPKWSMGFLNSQWGINEKELLNIVATYRKKRIPIDGFILDFDWKAWGKDHYGEFRWNPEKFPDGPDGKLKTMLGRQGIHLVGIMKPRIHIDTVEGRYATAHHMWLPGTKPFKDYFSHKLVKELDYDKPQTRKWFGRMAMKYAFDKGIVGWWNDEADTTDSNTEFLNMERSLYTAQRAQTDVRVWSINRDFWLGAQRYAYGMWSGDIDSGFKTMAKQRARMLSAISVGDEWWGMDGGGFNGHPSDENYARWIEFDAFAPIFRVHGTLGQKRQPWRYGPVAEKAATKAIRLRYRLLPYIYSYAHHDTVAGVGLVRPLTFGWPHDAKVRNDVDAWMFGKWLLVSPVVKQGATTKRIYLPPGTWTDWFTGKVYPGGQTVTVAVDNKTWSDIPLFVRQGAIIPTQPVMQYVGQHPVTTVGVDVFPSTKQTRFAYYDDDGDTYAYTHGKYYLQRLETRRGKDGVRFRLSAPQGSYTPALRYYLVKVHGVAATRVSGVDHRYASLKALQGANGEGWASGRDRFGPVTWVRVAANQAKTLQMH